MVIIFLMSCENGECPYRDRLIYFQERLGPLQLLTDETLWSQGPSSSEDHLKEYLRLKGSICREMEKGHLPERCKSCFRRLIIGDDNF